MLCLQFHSLDSGGGGGGVGSDDGVTGGGTKIFLDNDDRKVRFVSLRKKFHSSIDMGEKSVLFCSLIPLRF